MNKALAPILLLFGALLPAPLSVAQDSPASPVAAQAPKAAPVDAPQTPAREPLLRFDLDFKGGTPEQLVQAISAAQGRHLNMIIPTEYAATQLPPLKMNSVTVPELFRALSSATRIGKEVRTGPATSQMDVDGVEFRSDGSVTNTSVWYLRKDGFLRAPTSQCRYYLLEPYLKRGLTVDDVTTALQTGWRMAGEKDLPRLSYHKETTLLIAVGDPVQLGILETMLQALGQKEAKAALGPTPASTATTPAK